MNFNYAQIQFRKALLDQLALYGISLPVIALDQPHKAGRVDTGIYYKLLNPVNHGWQARRYDPRGKDSKHQEGQHYEAMIQVTALMNQEDALSARDNWGVGPDNLNYGPPATFGNDQSVYVGSVHDIAATAQMIVNSLPFVEAMRAKKIGVQRASAIRTPTFINDKDDYEIEASFDLRISFTRIINPLTPIVDAHGIDFLRV